VCLPDCHAEPEDSRIPSWTSDWQSLWSWIGLPHVEKRLLRAFQVVSHDNNPVLAGSTTRSLQVQGIFYGIVDSMTSPVLLDDDPSPERRAKVSSFLPEIFLNLNQDFRLKPKSLSTHLIKLLGH